MCSGEIGFYEVNEKIQLWNFLKSQQSDDFTESALAGSVFGWDCPAAFLAFENSKNHGQYVLDEQLEGTLQ